MRISPKRESILDDGWYPATIGEVEERETKFGEKLLFPFEVDAGDVGVVAIDVWISISDHPKANLVKWAKQLFGDREFDTVEFTDAKVEVFVEEAENADGEVKNYVRKLRPEKGNTNGKPKPKSPKPKGGDVTIDEGDFENLPL
jgi:hypothetical protein